MCAASALKTKAPQLKTQLPKSVAQKVQISSRSGKSKVKVIELKLAASKKPEAQVTKGVSKKPFELSPAKKELLVLKYRLKARKLARSILRKWHARLELQEVDSIVDLSLCEAVRRYNPAKGASFMTFLFYHLRGNLIRAVTVAANSYVVPGLEQEGNDEGGRSSRGGMLASEVVEALCSSEGELPDDALLRKEMVQISAEACSKLDPLEKEVIERIYMKEEQLLDIASRLGYSRCHISRVKRRALETLYDTLSDAMALEKSKAPSFNDDEGVSKKIRRRRSRMAAELAA